MELTQVHMFGIRDGWMDADCRMHPRRARVRRPTGRARVLPRPSGLCAERSAPPGLAPPKFDPPKRRPGQGPGAHAACGHDARPAAMAYGTGGGQGAKRLRSDAVGVTTLTPDQEVEQGRSTARKAGVWRRVALEGENGHGG